MVEGWPFWAVYAVFFVVVLARANATYWAGRGLRAGGGRTRWAGHLDRPAVARTEAVVRRFGPPLVALSFLTVGVQTLVNAAAGALRMPLSRYIPAAVVGSLAWAGLYTAVGFAVVEAWVGDRAWWTAALGVAVVAGLVLLSHRLARRLQPDRASRTGRPPLG